MTIRRAQAPPFILDRGFEAPAVRALPSTHFHGLHARKTLTFHKQRIIHGLVLLLQTGLLAIHRFLDLVGQVEHPFPRSLLP